MKRVRLHHYFAGIVVLSAYCSGFVHLWFVDASPFSYPALILVWPVVFPFMRYQETVYLTPAVHDFPYLMAIYPFYFALLLSPLAFIARRNRNSIG